MSRWTDAFATHGVHEAVEELKVCVDAAGEAAPAVELTEIRRLQKAVQFVQSSLSSVDPELVPEALLEGIEHGIRHSNLLPKLQSFYANDFDSFELSDITAANDQLSSVLPTVYGLAGLGKSVPLDERIESVEKLFDHFSQTVERESESFNASLSKYSTRLSELSTQATTVENLCTKLGQQLSETRVQWQEQFTTEQAARHTEFSGDQATRQTEFSEAQSGWLAEFTTWFAEHKAKADADALETQNTFQSSIDQYLAAALDKHDKILELHGLVAGDAVTAGYLGDGKKEREAANFWRWTSLTFILLTIVWLGLSYSLPYFGVNHDGEIWEVLVRTASLTGVLLLGAGYAARQSKLHRDQERKARWFGLEVKSFDPFISSLGPDEQKALREKLADRLFGQKDDQVTVKEAHLDGDMLKTVSDLVLKLAGRGS